MDDFQPPQEPKPPPSRTFRGCAKRWLAAFNKPWAFLTMLYGVIVALVGAAVTYYLWIEKRVEQIVKSEEFVAAVARQTRPSMVFDTEGRVLADMGASDFLLEAPKVTLYPRKGGEELEFRLFSILIQPKRPLRSEPIIQSLDIGNVGIEADRAQGFDWKLVVSARSFGSSLGGDEPKLPPPRFRLEIVP